MQRNVYNTLPGPPRVKIGNWVEERALWEETQRAADNPQRHASACDTMHVQSSDPMLTFYSETTNQTYGDFDRHIEPVFDPVENPDIVGRPKLAGPGAEARYLRRAELEWQEYTRMRYEDFEKTRTQVDREGRETFSTTRTDYYLPEIERPETQPRQELAMTRYNQGAVTYGRTGRSQGPGVSTGVGRHSQFSVPISEYKGGPWKDE